MTLEQLRIFVAVAEREHVTQAARELRLTQSAVSAAVSALEARYATKLFHRVGRRIELTQAGRVFLVEARSVLARAAAAETALFDLAGLKRGSLRLAASQTVGNYWLPPLIQEYRRAHPGISVALSIGNTETVAAAVKDGAADLGFIEGTVDAPDLTVKPVAEDELVLVVAGALWRRKGRALSAEDARHLPWVFRERGSGTRALFETALRKIGVAPADLHIIQEFPTNESVRAAVVAGAGATVLSRLAVAQALKSGSLVTLEFPLPRRKFFVLSRKEHYASQAEKAFHALMETCPEATRTKAR